MRKGLKFRKSPRSMRTTGKPIKPDSQLVAATKNARNLMKIVDVLPDEETKT